MKVSKEAEAVAATEAEVEVAKEGTVKENKRVTGK